MRVETEESLLGASFSLCLSSKRRRDPDGLWANKLMPKDRSREAGMDAYIHFTQSLFLYLMFDLVILSWHV